MRPNAISVVRLTEPDSICVYEVVMIRCMIVLQRFLAERRPSHPPQSHSSRGDNLLLTLRSIVGYSWQPVSGHLKGCKKRRGNPQILTFPPLSSDTSGWPAYALLSPCFQSLPDKNFGDSTNCMFWLWLMKFHEARLVF